MHTYIHRKQIIKRKQKKIARKKKDIIVICLLIKIVNTVILRVCSRAIQFNTKMITINWCKARYVLTEKAKEKKLFLHVVKAHEETI